MNAPKLLTAIENKKLLYLKAESNYTYLFTKKGERLVSAYSLKVYDDLLPSGSFIRIDRSHLVHVSFIQEYQLLGNQAWITLKNQCKYPLPRRKQKTIIKQLDSIKLKS